MMNVLTTWLNRGRAEALTPPACETAQALFTGALALPDLRLGSPQRSGALTVIPLFGPEYAGFVRPSLGAKLSSVRGYGDVELSNTASQGIAIVPLHMGYIQHGAQNHALCRSALIAAGQKARFTDACCVQAAQCGYLEGREQWFFILPLALRAEALARRGAQGYSKLWDGISKLNRRHGLAERGHLEQILTRKRAYLTQYQSRFELQEGQTGALFFLHRRLIGVEIAPTKDYFRDVWMPLVCFCYGTAAMQAEEAGLGTADSVPFPAASLPELRALLSRSRAERDAEVNSWLAEASDEFQNSEEERQGALRLKTIQGSRFAGQVVEQEGTLVYASLFTLAQDEAAEV